MQIKNRIIEKMRESVASVLPIALTVTVLCFSIAPVSTDLMLAFVLGTAMLIAGLGLFTYGAENSMTLIGTYTGARLTKSRKLWLILALSFFIGVMITVAEPDLQVLAENVPHIDTGMLMLTVSVGVGIFLVICMLRILFAVPLKWVLLASYGLVFALAAFSDADFLSVAFDSGGVTTGPMTVPFIMAMGVGVSSIRSDKNAEADSFGLVALCSIGPVLAVLLLGFFYENQSGAIAAQAAQRYLDTVALSRGYLKALPGYALEVALALSPVVVFFLLFQLFALKLPRTQFLRILAGIVFTYTGLVVFLLGVNVGFSSLGVILGKELAQGWTRYLLIPIAALLGWFIVSAEPAVHVLNKQVEEISAGAVSEKMMRVSLSIAIAAAMGLAMVRVLTGISILWFLVPGYALALAMSFFVPQMFTAIAFDSGGVASGPMTATFMLPFAMGVCEASGGNLLTDAFGLVALVAMMPLIIVQLTGIIYVVKTRGERKAAVPSFGDEEIIELWEVR